ncbi:MAG: hypothetical protein ABIH76_05920 [Candidatus Bathyarchaeota archaeon]
MGVIEVKTYSAYSDIFGGTHYATITPGQFVDAMTTGYYESSFYNHNAVDQLFYGQDIELKDIRFMRIKETIGWASIGK